MGIDLQIAWQSPELPDADDFGRWVDLALDGEEGELCLRLVDLDEGQQLNQHWRGGDAATNVLSFPSDLSVPGLRHLGDIVVCGPVVLREAAEQRKTPVHHFAHLTIHGVLHLRGFDHVEADEATVMEALEIELLAREGIPDPYAERPNSPAMAESGR